MYFEVVFYVRYDDAIALLESILCIPFCGTGVEITATSSHLFQKASYYLRLPSTIIISLSDEV